MKRKVIQIADSTQLVSLPRKWAIRHNIKKGDELEVLESKGQLVISTEMPNSAEKIEVNVTDLDRTSIVLLIRGLYKRGFEEIKVISNASTVAHFRTGKKKTFLNVVHSEVNRLPGVEVIEQKENYCVIKAISEPTLKDIETVIRRILLLIVDAGRDVINGAKNFDPVLLEGIGEEKHDTVSKFTSYSMRLLNMSHTEDQLFMFSLVNLLDKVMDYIKDTSRLVLLYNKKMHPESIKVLEKTFETFALYQRLHFKMDHAIVNQISQSKEDVRSDVLKALVKVPKEEALILETFQSTLELYRGIIELRLAMS